MTESELKYPYSESTLPSGYTLTQEVYSNHGVAAAVGRWGNRTEKLEADTTGFDTLWQSTTELSPDYEENLDRHLYDEYCIGTTAIMRVCEQLNWHQSKVDALVIGNGLLTEPGNIYAQELSVRSDLPVEATESLHGSASFSDACASWTRAMHYALRMPSLQGKNVLVCDVEHMTREMGLKKYESDALSKQVFSNGYACMGLVPGLSFQYLFGGEYQVRDIKGALSARVHYSDLFTRNGDLTKRDGFGEYCELPTPPDDYWINMQGGPTSEFFINMLSDFLPYLKEQFSQHYPEVIIDRVLPHHPSRQMMIASGRALQNAGFIETIDRPSTKKIGWKELEWCVNDGNASGATAGIVTGRKLPEIKPEEIIMGLGFGAGGKASAWIARAFPNDPQPMRELRERSFYAVENFDNPHLDKQAKVFIPQY